MSQHINYHDINFYATICVYHMSHIALIPNKQVTTVLAAHDV